MNGLYRDDGLALLKNASGPEADRFRKTTTSHLKQYGLSISINTNLKTVNFLNVSLNQNNGTYYPYREPNNDPLYVPAKSNHPHPSSSTFHSLSTGVTL